MKKIIEVITIFAFLILLFLLGCTKPANNNNINVKDSINIIDSVVYTYRDSIVLNVRDSVIYNVRVRDSVQITFKDSINWIDSVRVLDLHKFLFNDEPIDEDIHYLSLQILGDSIKHIAEKNFEPDKKNYFELKYYFDNKIFQSNEITIQSSFYKESGLSEKQTVALPYSYNKGYMIFDLGTVFKIDSIILLTNQPGVEMSFYLAGDDEKYSKDGAVFLNDAYIPNRKDVRYINISTVNGLNWEIKSIRVFGK